MASQHATLSVAETSRPQQVKRIRAGYEAYHTHGPKPFGRKPSGPNPSGPKLVSDCPGPKPSINCSAELPAQRDLAAGRTAAVEECIEKLSAAREQQKASEQASAAFCSELAAVAASLSRIQQLLHTKLEASVTSLARAEHELADTQEQLALKSATAAAAEARSKVLEQHLASLQLKASTDSEMIARLTAEREQLRAEKAATWPVLLKAQVDLAATAALLTHTQQQLFKERQAQLASQQAEAAAATMVAEVQDVSADCSGSTAGQEGGMAAAAQEGSQPACVYSLKQTSSLCRSAAHTFVGCMQRCFTKEWAPSAAVPPNAQPVASKADNISSSSQQHSSTCSPERCELAPLNSSSSWHRWRAGAGISSCLQVVDSRHAPLPDISEVLDMVVVVVEVSGVGGSQAGAAMSKAAPVEQTELDVGVSVDGAAA